MFGKVILGNCRQLRNLGIQHYLTANSVVVGHLDLDDLDPAMKIFITPP